MRCGDTCAQLAAGLGIGVTIVHCWIREANAPPAAPPIDRITAAAARRTAAAARPVAVQATRYGRTVPGAAGGSPYSSGPVRNKALARPSPTPRTAMPAPHRAWRRSGPGRTFSS
ncbi:hypothetical protein [Streptomyces enissocaesilis]|uniref:hypothetical protein n=1 Tax=Streptomyces enissocaesilis TaxID=332589 RepID=UPI003CD09442